MERRETFDIRSSSSGTGTDEPSSSAASSSVPVTGDQTAAAAVEEQKHKCCICNNEFRTQKALWGHMRIHPRSGTGVKPPAAAEQQGRDVRESAVAEERSRNVRKSAAAEQSIPVGKSVPVNQRAEEDEDVNPRRWESVVNQLLLFVEMAPQWLQGDDGGSSEYKITSDSSIARCGGGGCSGEVISVVAAVAEAGLGTGVAAAGTIIAERNGTVSDGKNGTSSKKKGSSSSTSAAGGSGAHTCDKCGRTFETGQSLGGHMRKHYDGPPIITNKKRTLEQLEETPAPTVERRVREPAVPTAPLESYNPALLSQSAQASDGGDCERNREELERSSAGNGARRLHEFDLNELPEAEEEEPKNAPQPEPERRDDDGDDDELLSSRLGQFDMPKSSGV